MWLSRPLKPTFSIRFLCSLTKPRFSGRWLRNDRILVKRQKLSWPNSFHESTSKSTSYSRYGGWGMPGTEDITDNGSIHSCHRSWERAQNATGMVNSITYTLVYTHSTTHAMIAKLLSEKQRHWSSEPQPPSLGVDSTDDQTDVRPRRCIQKPARYRWPTEHHLYVM